MSARSAKLSAEERAYLTALPQPLQQQLLNGTAEDLREWLHENPPPTPTPMVLTTSDPEIALTQLSTPTRPAPRQQQPRGPSAATAPQISIADFQALQQTIKELQLQISQLQTTSAPPVVPVVSTTPVRKFKVNKPKEFHGSREETTTFLAQCDLVFKSDPYAFANHEDKVHYVASFLRGDAFKWYEAAVHQVRRKFVNFDEFEALIKTTFGQDSTIHQDKAFADLRKLRQTKSCQSYSTKFIQLAAKVLIDENAKMQLYKEGLKDNVKLHLIGIHPQPTSLASLINAAVAYDDAYHNLKGSAPKGSFSAIHHAASSSTSASGPTSSSEPTPMDLDTTNVKKQNSRGKLTSQEKQRRIDEGLCVYCGSKDCGGIKDLNDCRHLKSRNAGEGVKGHGK